MPSFRPWTLILPYYENPGMLSRQLEWIGRWPEELRKGFHLIVVDDGSPTMPAIGAVHVSPPELGFAFSLYAIEVDVRWNWLACRNLGMAEAETEWRLMTDIDHLVPEATAHRIARQKLKPDHIYRFARRDWPDLPNPKMHPNSWLMTAAMFEATGGYDERFSGFYGTDGMFRDRCAAAAKRIEILPEHLIRVPRDVIPDASTTTYGRKEQQDHMGVQRIRGEIQRSGDLRPKRGLFPWRRIL